jgi:hypothetical protein
MIFTSFSMSPAQESPGVAILSNIIAEEGTSHRVLKHRGPVVHDDASGNRDDKESPGTPPSVEKWMKELSISATAYHSRGREPQRTQSPAPKTVETDFLPEKKWNTQTESSVAFHVVGVRKVVPPPDEVRSVLVTKSGPIDVITTESTVCFHNRRARQA